MVGGFTSRMERSATDAPPQTVAVVDCGTSSVRATIAEIGKNQQRILEELHYPIDLTPAFISEKLDRDAMETVAEAFAALTEAAKSYDVHVLRAVATSALREASNADVLVELVRTRTGVDLEIIDSSEEARLYVLALSDLLKAHKKSLNGTTLMMDIGGGGTSVSLIRDGRLVFSVDEHFGTVRLIQQLAHLHEDSDFGVTIDRFGLGAARMMLSRVPERKIDNLVVNGGDVRRLLALLNGKAGGDVLAKLSAKSVNTWCDKVLPMTPQERAVECGFDDPLTAALILPAATMIRHLAEFTGHKQVLVPQLTLRDGLLADVRPGAFGPNHLDAESLRAEALQLVHRFGGDSAYAENTAALATQIFDQTQSLHGLQPRHRTMLEFAALVHDIGSYLNVRNRHKHTMYIIQSVDIAGLNQAEKELVAHVARYHRRSPPLSHHAGFQALPRHNRVVVSYLAAILRVAYCLDVERSQRIRRVRCEVDGDTLLLHVDRRQIALERWSISGKSQLFEEVFGLRVVVVPREED